MVAAIPLLDRLARRAKGVVVGGADLPLLPASPVMTV